MANSDRINSFIDISSYGMNSTIVDDLSINRYQNINSYGMNSTIVDSVNNHNIIDLGSYGMNSTIVDELTKSNVKSKASNGLYKENFYANLKSFGTNSTLQGELLSASNRSNYGAVINNSVDNNLSKMNINFDSQQKNVEHSINEEKIVEKVDNNLQTANSKDKSNILSVPKSKPKEYGQVENVVGYDQHGGWGMFGYETMASSGCGPTAISIAFASLTQNKDITPETIVNYMNTHNSNGERVEYISSSMTSAQATCWKDVMPIMNHFANVYGTSENPLYTKAVSNLDELKKILASGNAIAVTIEETKNNGYGLHLSDNSTMWYEGHYIALTGVAKDKVMSDPNNPSDFDCIIADPACPRNNGLTVSAQEVALGSNNSEYAPSFWVLSTEPLD